MPSGDVQIQPKLRHRLQRGVGDDREGLALSRLRLGAGSPPGRYPQTGRSRAQSRFGVVEDADRPRLIDDRAKSGGPAPSRVAVVVHPF